MAAERNLERERPVPPRSARAITPAGTAPRAVQN